MSRGAGSKSRAVDADFNPIGTNLANNFLQARNQNHLDPRYDVKSIGNGKLSEEKEDSSKSISPFLNDRAERDVWAGGGEHLSTNKLSLMLSDMQGRLKDLPSLDPSEDGLPWRSPSTDSLDASELGSVLFGHLRTDYSESPTVSNNPDTETSPGPNLDHKRIRSLRRSNSEDDNDSLSSVSTASTSSYQRARRPSGLSQPGVYLHHHNPEPNNKLRGLGILTSRRFGDSDYDYISDGGSEASFDSAIRSHKSHRSQRSAKSQGSYPAQSLPNQQGGQVLTKLQLQKQMLQQMQPLPANATINGTRAHNSSIDQSSTGTGAVQESVQPAQGAESRDRSSAASGSNGRFSPPRARPTSAGSEAHPSTTSIRTATGSGTPSTPGAKPRSTTPTGIPRAVHSSSTAHTPSHILRTTDQTELAAEGQETIKRMAPSSSQAPSAASSSRTGSLPASEVEVRPGRSKDAAANRNGQHRSASVDRETSSTTTRTPEDSRRSASVERGTPLSPIPESALRSPIATGPAAAPATATATTVGYTEKKNSPLQHHGSAKKFEMKEDPYPERGRLRIRSASIPRTSAVESVAPPPPAPAAGQPIGRSPAHAPDHTNNVHTPAHRERSSTQPYPRSGSVTRSDPHAATARSATHGGSASSHPTPPHSAPGQSAASYRSPPGKVNRTGGSNHTTPQAATTTPTVRTPNSASATKRGRTSLGSAAPSAMRSPLAAGAGTARSPATRAATPSSSGARRKSDGAKEIAPKKTPTQKERRFSLPSPTGPITPPQPTTSASKFPARINTTVVPVRTSRALTPNRVSSSSLSTTGSLSASAPNSRSSTPTSLSGASTTSGSRTSRRGGTPNRTRSTLTPVQLKSLNPYPLRNSLSPRHSFEGNPLSTSPAVTPSSQTRSPASVSPSGRSNSAPRGRLSASKPNLYTEASSPGPGESDHESLSSPISVVHSVQNRLLLPPPEAVPFQGSTRPLLFMMSMAHLSQESISGVYDSANYHAGPRHASRGGRSGPKYVMRGAESVPAAQARTPERLSLPLPGSPKDDYLHDQGSGNTATTLATASSYDSGDDEPAGSSPGPQLLH